MSKKSAIYHRDLGFPQVDELYMTKENRDKRSSELKEKGYMVAKGVTGPQQIHPHYVVDYPSQEAKDDNGFGNKIYHTSFSQLYKIEAWNPALY